jgi:hypothetical protein
LELVEVTTHNKDGPAMVDQFEAIIDHVENKYKCTIIYFTTDADGRSKKGHLVLVKRRPWLFAPSCWAHQVSTPIKLTGWPELINTKFQLILGDYFRVYEFAQEIAESATSLIGWLNNHGKVRKMFDSAQAQISLDRRGKPLVLAYLVANLTRWTTHYITFIRLLHVQDALKLEVMQHRASLIQAQVGAAKSTENYSWLRTLRTIVI